MRYLATGRLTLHLHEGISTVASVSSTPHRPLTDGDNQVWFEFRADLSGSSVDDLVDVIVGCVKVFDV
jgi:hypothetical protein